MSETDFREALAHLAGGVVIVTARDAEGRPQGMTATAVCSVSLDPPLVMACMARKSSTHRAVVESGSFALNLLRADAEPLARRFATAGRSAGVDKFRELDVRELVTGAPLLPGALGACDCVVVDAVRAGDHTIFVGRVEGAEREGADAGPLLYYLGQYGSIGRAPDRAEPSPR